MKAADFSSAGLADVANAVSSGTLDRRDYVEFWLDRIGKIDGRLHAFIHFDPEQVRSQISNVSGPLAGVPLALKDNIVTADAPTTCASRILGNFRSPVDASAVERLKRSGAVIAGKTNLDEFAMGSSTEYSAFGVTRNPWDLQRVAGGSSGGSAAAVAARLVPAALGSETGGSVRQPAALCGVVGLKPTYGRISRSGLVAFASSLDQIGILTRTAADCALVLREIAGRDDADSTSSPVAVPDYVAEAGREIRGIRLGVVAGIRQSLSDVSRDNFDTTLGILRGEGCTIEEVELPTMSSAIAVYYVIANAEASANLARFDGVRYGLRSEASDELQALYRRSRGEGFGAEVRRRIMLGTFVLSSGYYDAYYGRAQQVRELMRADFAAAFSRVDCLVTPTTPEAAFRIGEKTTDPLSMYLSDIFTAPANLVGIPAVAVPSGFTGEGLPLSLQIMGPHFSEGLLLAVAQRYESRSGFALEIPPPVRT